MHRNTLSRTITELGLDIKGLRGVTRRPPRSARPFSLEKRASALADRHPHSVSEAIKNGSISLPFELFRPQPYCFLCVVVLWWAGAAAVETGLPFLSSRTPSVKVIMNGLGV